MALLTRFVTGSAVTTSEVTADWHELMTPQRIMRPSTVALANNCPAVQHTLHRHTIAQSATLGQHPVAVSNYSFFRPVEVRRLSWPEHTIWQMTWARFVPQPCSPIYSIQL